MARKFAMPPNDNRLFTKSGKSIVTKSLSLQDRVDVDLDSLHPRVLVSVGVTVSENWNSMKMSRGIEVDVPNDTDIDTFVGVVQDWLLDIIGDSFESIGVPEERQQGK